MILVVILVLGSFSSFLTFFLGGSQEGDESLGVDPAVVIDFHGIESIVNFFAGEFLSPSHQGVSESETDINI